MINSNSGAGSLYPFEIGSTFQVGSGVLFPKGVVYGAILYPRTDKKGAVSIAEMRTTYTDPGDFLHTWTLRIGGEIIDDFRVEFRTTDLLSDSGDVLIAAGLLPDEAATGIVYYGDRVCGTVRCTEDFRGLVLALPHYVEVTADGLVFDNSVMFHRRAAVIPELVTDAGERISAIYWDYTDFVVGTGGVVSVREAEANTQDIPAPIKKITINGTAVLEYGVSYGPRGDKRINADVALSFEADSSIRVKTERGLITIGRGADL